MNNPEVIYSTLSNIDKDNCCSQLVSSNTPALSEYSLALAKTILSKNDKMEFSYSRTTKEVISKVLEILNDYTLFQPNATIIANRLAEKQDYHQNTLGTFVDLQDGSLVQTLISADEGFYYLVSKVDPDTFLSASGDNFETGFSKKHPYYKTCIMEFDLSNNLITAKVADTNYKISNYWWKDFLELDRKRLPEDNSKISFNLISKEIKKIEKLSLKDSEILKQHLINYYNTQLNFSIDELVNQVIGNYNPINPNVNVDYLKSTLYSIADRGKFDQVFNIDKEPIKKHLRNKPYKANNSVSFYITNGIPDELIESFIHSDIVDDEKYILIKSEDDDTFMRFLRKDEVDTVEASVG